MASDHHGMPAGDGNGRVIEQPQDARRRAWNELRASRDQRPEVLRSSMTVWMVGVGRTAPEADRDERQHRGHDVAA